MLLLTFSAGVNRYAVEVSRVVELVPRVELRPVPYAPAFLAGLLGYRGESSPLSIWASCLMLLLARIDSILASSWSIRRRANAIGMSRIDTIRLNTMYREPGRRSGSGSFRIDRRACQRPDHGAQRTGQACRRAGARAPYLRAIIHTDEGIMQLIAVEKVWGAMIQGTTFGPDIVHDQLKDQ